MFEDGGDTLTVGAVMPAVDLGPDSLDAEALLDGVASFDRVIAFAYAAQARLLAQFAALRPTEFAADEVAPTLRVSRIEATRRLSMAVDLTTRLPETLDALQRGELDLAKARAISELTAALPREKAAAVQAAVLPDAAEKTAPQLRAAVRRAVVRADPDGAKRREAYARAERRVVLAAADDGMAELYALLPAPEAVAIYDRVNRYARAVPADGRTADQRRADCFTDLLLGRQRRVTAQIHVTVPADTLRGLSEEPGRLRGYGPITAATARDIAGGAFTDDTTWRRILTDPATGAVREVGRQTYRPSRALADHVKARDVTCRFPGCRQPAHCCDTDHTVPFPEGSTEADNLGLLCRHHHRLKHETDWTVRQERSGRFVWTSPTGRRYVTKPDPPAPP
jgi:hypothetical protein